MNKMDGDDVKLAKYRSTTGFGRLQTTVKKAFDRKPKRLKARIRSRSETQNETPPVNFEISSPDHNSHQQKLPQNKGESSLLSQPGGFGTAVASCF